MPPTKNEELKSILNIHCCVSLRVYHCLMRVVFTAVRPLYYMLTSEKSRESTFASMRTIVLAMERLLNLRHREGTL